MEWSSIKSDVTKHTFSGNGGRQPPSVFSIPLTNARFHVCLVPLLFLSALLIFTPSTAVVFFLSSHLFDARERIRGGRRLLKQVTSWSCSPSSTIKSRCFTGSPPTNQEKKKKDGNCWCEFLFTFHEVYENLDANAHKD